MGTYKAMAPKKSRKADNDEAKDAAVEDDAPNKQTQPGWGIADTVSHGGDWEPPDDPSIDNSMSWQTAFLILVLTLVITDQVWGHVNRNCLSTHASLSLKFYKKQLHTSVAVVNYCNNTKYFKNDLLQSTCVWLHPTSQDAVFYYDRSMAHYDVAMNCFGRYAGYMGMGFFIATLVITVINPHTRAMVPWILRNPMGLEVN